MNSLIRSGIAIGLFLGMASTISAAEFTIENRTNETIHVAIGFAEVVVDPVFGSGSGFNWTEGWFDVEPNQTRTLTFKHRPRHLYAASASKKWQGEVVDWVKPRMPFNIKHPVTEVKATAEGWEKRQFLKLKDTKVILQ